MKGIVRWFNNKLKYGIIESDCGRDHFAHWSDVAKDGYKSLQKNAIVEFDSEETTKGCRARKIKTLCMSENPSDHQT